MPVVLLPKIDKNKTECWPFFGSFLQSLASMLSKNPQHLFKKASKISNHGGLGALGAAPGGICAPRRPKAQKTNLEDPPGAQFGNQNLRKKYLETCLSFLAAFFESRFSIDFRLF